MKGGTVTQDDTALISHWEGAPPPLAPGREDRWGSLHAATHGFTPPPHPAPPDTGHCTQPAWDNNTTRDRQCRVSLCGLTP
ncbi:hypothetical protein AAFF_G00173890 [Aldrovandia affinis]|uniref:Uncharacterized protein n=1 Tax=Aldrovandia affinis TaxID=143900 RepID=A0AAD7SZ63_9TELE|nr:hypothetical protein AAFF_G00173890 [Aldrovandia affinis]